MDALKKSMQIGTCAGSGPNIRRGMLVTRRARRDGAHSHADSANQAEKATEAHDSVCHAARNLFYEEVINLTDSLISPARLRSKLVCDLDGQLLGP
jgi:hypothetical protein